MNPVNHIDSLESENSETNNSIIEDGKSTDGVYMFYHFVNLLFGLLCGFLANLFIISPASISGWVITVIISLTFALCISYLGAGKLGIAWLSLFALVIGAILLSGLVGWMANYLMGSNNHTYIARVIGGIIGGLLLPFLLDELFDLN